MPAAAVGEADDGEQEQQEALDEVMGAADLKLPWER